MEMKFFRQIIFCLVCAATALGQSTITVSPGGLSLKGTAGGTMTQRFTVANGTSSFYKFDIEVVDVIVQNGERKFIAAGRLPGSIAALAVAPPEPVFLNPGKDASVFVTFVVPRETNIRAVAVFFRGQPAAGEKASNIRLNLGAVIDFSMSDQIQLESKQLTIEPQTVSSNLKITEELANVGNEPVIAKGVAAILDQPGKLVGKTSFTQKRLLPSEHNSLSAEYAGSLRPGRYRIVCSFEYGGRTMTRTAELLVP
jgi:hypothetical protein